MESSALQPVSAADPARELASQLGALLSLQAAPASSRLLQLSRELGPASFAWDVGVLHRALAVARHALAGLGPQADSDAPTHWLGLEGGPATGPGALPEAARDTLAQAVLEAHTCVRGLAEHDRLHGAATRGALLELQQHWRALDAVVARAAATLAQLWRHLRGPAGADDASTAELRRIGARSLGFAEAIKRLHAALQATLDAHRTGTAIVAARVTLLEMVDARMTQCTDACRQWRDSGDAPASRLALASSLDAALAGCADLRRSESELARALQRLREALQQHHGAD